MNMVYKTSVIPISREPLQVTVEADSETGETFLHVGSWAAIRPFLVKHVVKGTDFSIVDAGLSGDLPQTFDLEASEVLISESRFTAVKKIVPKSQS
jgi:hypothetical protein